MKKEENNKRMAFFDQLASKWDSWHDLPQLAARLNKIFEQFNIQSDETVMDAGCGTGNLTGALLTKLGAEGRVIAVDISSVMLREAQLKYNEPRVTWLQTPIDTLPLKDSCCDRVICFSAWPHFQDQRAAVCELRRVLKPGGSVHVLHFISREAVNNIHKEADPSVAHDMLPPVEELAQLFAAQKFAICTTIDNAESYLLSARKDF